MDKLFITFFLQEPGHNLIFQNKKYDLFFKYQLKVAAKGDKCDERGGSFCLLDYESMDSFVVVVTTQDSGSPSLNLTMSLTIQVVDVNDPPNHLVLSVTSIPEDTRVGELLGSVEVSSYCPYSLTVKADYFKHPLDLANCCAKGDNCSIFIF